ncbi:MAG: hypothetical protein JNJ73_01330 [Hyphomonadaceae bacterium]|nr:hypothetical protein [Hyphomonadaceae bacterium]
MPSILESARNGIAALRGAIVAIIVFQLLILAIVIAGGWLIWSHLDRAVISSSNASSEAIRSRIAAEEAVGLARQAACATARHQQAAEGWPGTPSVCDQTVNRP